MAKSVKHLEAEVAALARRAQVLEAMLLEAVAREFAARMGAP